MGQIGFVGFMKDELFSRNTQKQVYIYMYIWLLSVLRNILKPESRFYLFGKIKLFLDSIFVKKHVFF